MATEATGVPATRPADVGLRREIGLIGATWASETSIIGSGWLFGAYLATVAAGPAALYGWIIGGVCVVILALIHAELGAMYPIAGGTARFPHLAFGSIAGISFGFFSWLQAVVVAPVECYAVMTYGSYYWHSLFNTTTGHITTTGFIMTIILMAIFTALNFLAVRMFARINSAITWWKVAIPVLTIIILLFKFHPGNFSPPGGFNPGGMKAVFAAIPGAAIVFAYLGFEQADQLAGEVKNPKRNLPLAIIIACLLGTAIYILLQVVFIGAMPPRELTHGFAGITNPVVIAGPFAGVAGLAGLAFWATILRIDAFVSPFGTGMIYQTSTSRVGYGLARNRYFPQAFQWVDRNGIPWFSLIMAFVFGIFFLLPFPSWNVLVVLVTSASVLMYSGSVLSLGVFRRTLPDAERPYKIPGAAVLNPIAFIICGLLIYWSGFTTVWKLGVCVVIGYVLIGISMAFDKQRPPLDWKSATWLIPFLIGMGIISWQGQFSGESSKAPPLNTGHIHFWWDLGVVAVFCLVIYYWAIYTCLPREETLELIARQSGHEELPDTGLRH
ncbi:MAG: APC family permease [Streptosporangiaceae bacterium]|nr:APC family permease [Streptosporangiaceae bacterium]